ncbi:MAG: hypothetical protein CVT92_07120 [Bacteroidetes bacterium HGW-Bacteroidetes-1]|jgi:hypothetical protein|nr:MAG: hypothetical protein CVT92_07120 [Bacteroidetes bacterium HGW-Bacteroidetes-1]
MKKILLAILMIQFYVFGQAFSPKDWTIVETYTIPGKASGLAWDGTYIYFGIYGANGSNVHSFNPATGTSQLLFTNPTVGDSYGMTFDGQNLWIIDRGSTGNSYALQLSLEGNVVSQFTLPQQYMSGIAFDDGDFWVSSYYPDPGVIYKVSNTGTVLEQFAPPMTQTWDLAKHDETLWIVDYNGNMIFRVDEQGTMLESYPSVSQRPSGIVYDGNYLWVVDGALGSNSTLYKIDLGGAGTPQIAISQTDFNFGNVTVGTTDQIDFIVSNTGEAILNFSFSVPLGSYVFFPEGPFEINPGSSLSLTAYWNPMLYGALQATGYLSSNDPLNSEIELNFTGNALKSGPFLQPSETEHNFGNIRTGASKQWTLNIQNWGDATLEIYDINLYVDIFYLSDMNTVPVSLAPLEIVSFKVWFHPLEAGEFNSNMLISSNDPDQSPLNIPLSGNANDIYMPVGATIWQYNITGNYDNSPKAMIHIPDINADGKGDLVVASEDNYIRAFNGNASDITQVLWEIEIYSGAIYQQQGLTNTADINNDGFSDIIAGTAWGDRSVIAICSKTGIILWKYQTNNFGDGGWVYQVDAKYDYNNDDFPDVLAATGDDSDGTGPKRVFCLDGKTGSLIWNTPLNGAVFSVIGIADFNGDGIPDVIAGASNASETQGRVVGISGANGAIAWDFSTSGSSVFALEKLDDINGDGVADIIAGSFNGNYYLMNPVNGSVIEQGYIGNNLILKMIRMDDLNGDGFADIIPAHSGLSAIAIDGHNGQPIWTTPTPDKPWNLKRIPDISGDTINDIALGTLFQSNYAMFLNGASGEILFSEGFGEAVDAMGILPDMTGDGSWEMVAGGRNGKLVCYAGGPNAITNLTDFTKTDVSFVSASPNPFNASTFLTIIPDETVLSSVLIYNINGTIIWENSIMTFTRERNTIEWDGKNQNGQEQPQGLFFYEIKAGKQIAKGKLIRLENF